MHQKPLFIAGKITNFAEITETVLSSTDKSVFIGKRISQKA